MMYAFRRRWSLILVTTLAVLSIIGTVVITFVVDRSTCKSAVRAIENSRTMWEYAIEQNPGPEADAFLAEMNCRLPPAHCEGGRLVVDEACSTVPPGSS